MAIGTAAMRACVLTVAGALLFARPASSQAQTLSVDLISVHSFPDQATDQHGVAFTVTGVSGLWWIGQDETGAHLCWMVMDRLGKLVLLAIVVDGDGAIQSTEIRRAVSLADVRDFEDVVVLPVDIEAAAVTEENTPQVRIYDLTTGALINAVQTPPVYLTRRNNMGFEPLAFNSESRILWTCTEEAVNADGPVSTQAQGSTTRILRLNPTDGGVGSFESGPQYAYVAAPLHGTVLNSSRSGMVALVALPNGKFLSLERSYARVVVLPTFLLRIFEVDIAGATDVSTLPSLAGQSFVPVAKTQLWAGNLNNLEGLSLGPQLPDGDHLLFGVVDDGDAISLNNVATFRLHGSIHSCPADWNNADGLDSQDLFDFLESFFSGNGDFNHQDGTDSQDLFDYYEAFFTGCP